MYMFRRYIQLPGSTMRRYWLLTVPVIVVYLLVWTKISGNGRVPQDIKGTQSGQTGRKVPKHIMEQIKASQARADHKFADAIISGKRPEYKTFLTIAIPTISRPNGHSYIQNTLDSLLNNSNEEDRRGVIIVILLADVNETSRMVLNEQLLVKYRKHFDSGLMQTIQAPRSYYPEFEHLKKTYHHDMLRVKWRSKQNFDYAFMMEYSEQLSGFYLQLEDDVETVSNYMSKIKSYMSAFNEWTCLEFCELGFIAKLYHNYDLKKLSQLLKIFYNEQPNDVLYLHFNELMLQYRRFIHSPTIFQHKGHFSSLKLKQGVIIEDSLFADKQRSREKEYNKPVQVRQFGRVAGPEYAVWKQRKILNPFFGKQIIKNN